jgi:hypothetical protein
LVNLGKFEQNKQMLTLSVITLSIFGIAAVSAGGLVLSLILFELPRAGIPNLLAPLPPPPFV